MIADGKLSPCALGVYRYYAVLHDLNPSLRTCVKESTDSTLAYAVAYMLSAVSPLRFCSGQAAVEFQASERIRIADEVERARAKAEEEAAAAAALDAAAAAAAAVATGTTGTGKASGKTKRK